MAPALFVLLVGSAAFLTGANASKSGGAGAHPAPIDTLANGLPSQAVRAAHDWITICRRTIPRFVPDSLVSPGPSPIRFDSAWPDPLHKALETIGDRTLDSYSPDSGRFVNFDVLAEVSRDEDGNVSLERDADSAPILGDIAADTLWRVAFCGTCCSYDGACWVDTRRFVLTGLTQNNCAMEGDLRPFLDLYDLGLHEVRRWLGPRVSQRVLDLYSAAYDSALTARFGHARR